MYLDNAYKHAYTHTNVQDTDSVCVEKIQKETQADKTMW